MMRSQGWSGAAMQPYNELEYGGFRTRSEAWWTASHIETAPPPGRPQRPARAIRTGDVGTPPLMIRRLFRFVSTNVYHVVAPAAARIYCSLNSLFSP